LGGMRGWEAAAKFLGLVLDKTSSEDFLCELFGWNGSIWSSCLMAHVG